MKRFKNLLVVLPEGTPESALLQWSSVMGQASEAETIDLLCCEQAFLAEFPATEDTTAPSYSDQIESSAKDYLQGLNYKILRHQGNALRETLSRLSCGNYDLVVTSLHNNESRGLAERLARKSPAGVLSIPPDAKAPPSSIVTAIDFSGLSPLCIDWAEAFASLKSDVSGDPASKLALHATDLTIPTRATLTISENELKAWKLQGAQLQMQELLAESARSTEGWRSEIVESQLPGIDLTNRINKNPDTLLILGCHGRNAFSMALLGSQACEAIRRSKTPILVAKRKNDNLKFLRDLIGAN